MQWKIEYMDSVESWLGSLDQLQFKSLAKELKLVQMCGNQLRLPHSRSLGGGLFELRERRYGFRIYYCFDKGRVILLLHAGNKSSQDTDIKMARKLLDKVGSVLV